MRLLPLAAVVWLAGCASKDGGAGPPAVAEPLPELRLAEARTVFVELAQRADVSWQYAFAKVRGVNLSRDGGSVSFKLAYVDDKEKAYRPGECRIDLRGLQSVRVESVGSVVGAGKPRRWVRMDPQPCDLMWFFDEGDSAAAKRFAGSITRLASSTREEIDAERRQVDEAFEEAVRAHEKDPRRPLSEGLLRIEAAGRRARAANDLEKAVRAYDRVLEDAPWWPEGYRDRASVLGELGRYSAAAFDMKRYLRLEPRARDARQAQERIDEWEPKAR